MKKKEILPFLTKWMDPEGSDKDKYYMISPYVESKNTKLLETVEWWLPGAGEQEKWGDVDQRVQTSSHKINKFWGSNVQHGDYS